jgi:translation initiation factor 1
VKDFVGSEEALNELAKVLKSKCATGGNAKDGEIVLQGDVRQKAKAVLESLGYKVKLAGG